jgi:hypothetical protein
MNIKLLKNPDGIAISLIIALAIPVLYFSLLVPFEADTGDSVMHYFYARYAPQNPLLYLHHWAKPVFTLLASPFAQFGFAGMKLFNGLAGLLSAWFAFCVARKLGLKHNWLAIVFVMFAPAYFVKLFSGYTEPLFGLILIASVYLVLVQKPFQASVLLSFLPFVRSEGLILIIVFALYYLIKKRFWAIVLLTTGHVVYAVIGFFAGKSLLWMFTEIPYSVISAYGKGNLMHYPNQMLLTLGVPLFMLFIVGTCILLASLVIKKTAVISNYSLELNLLIFGSFLAYFLFHTFSWGFGLFGSMGLNRILTAMVPLLSIISLIGFNFLISWHYNGRFAYHALVYVPLIGYILIFPFLHNPASINFEKELCRSPEMKLLHSIASDLQKHYPDKFLYYSNPYLSYALNINHFDSSKHLCFTDLQASKNLHPNSLVIWDNWFSVVEERTDSTMLLQNPELTLLNRYEIEGLNTKNIFLVFGN